MSTVVIGVGNRDRGDDGAGLELAARLRTVAPMGVRIVELAGHSLALLDAWRGASLAVIADAACSGAPAGTVTRFEAHQQQLPAHWLQGSTHSFGVAEAIEVARALGELPARVIVYAVEGSRFDEGAGLSAGVEGGVNEGVSRVLDELSACGEVHSICGRRDRDWMELLGA